MTGAEIWLSAEDEKQHQLHREDIFLLPTLPYTVDEFYQEDCPIEFGRFKIETKLTPGQTSGATSFFFADQDEKTGERYRCAMHGGLGIGQMKPENLKREGIEEAMAHQFVKDCLELAERPVDIFLASHLNQANIDHNIPEDRQDYREFICKEVWGDVLKNRAETVMRFYPSVHGEKSFAAGK